MQSARRTLSAMALEWFGGAGRGAISELVRALKDTDPVVRKTTKNVLGFIAPEALEQDNAQEKPNVSGGSR